MAFDVVGVDFWMGGLPAECRILQAIWLLILDLDFAVFAWLENVRLADSGLKMEIARGCSRTVLLIGAYAIKFPNLRYRYPAMLWGLIHNLAERNWWRAFEGNDAGWTAVMRQLLCPVVWGDPFGLCVVMKRAKPLPREYTCPVVYEWLALRFALTGCECPAEKKSDSFGIIDGEIVAVDYA